VNYILTDIDYVPKDTGLNQVQLCALCGLTLSYHYQHANGRITCVRYEAQPEPQEAKHE
jgi:hypothetical protein